MSSEMRSFGVKFTSLKEIYTLEDMDDEMRDIVYWFNKLGMITISCCYGHDGTLNETNVIFDEDVSDKSMENFIVTVKSSPESGYFYKWARRCGGEVKYNWVYEVHSKILKKEEMENMTNNLKRYFDKSNNNYIGYFENRSMGD